MSRKFVFGREARLDYKQAVAWYDNETGSQAVGDRFTSVINKGFEEILANPDRFGPSIMGGRRMFLEPFPYSIQYVQLGEIIHVVAIWHERRSPASLHLRYNRFQ